MLEERESYREGSVGIYSTKKQRKLVRDVKKIAGKKECMFSRSPENSMDLDRSAP